MICFRNLTETEAFGKLVSYRESLGSDKIQLTPEAVREYTVPAGKELYFSYAAKGADPLLLDLFRRLADEQQCVEKYRALLRGEEYNTVEKRMVLHHLCRGSEGLPVSGKAAEKVKFFEEQERRFCEFADSIRREGKIKTVIQIGIGGSGQGPKAVFKALKWYALSEGKEPVINADFMENTDYDEVVSILNETDIEKTLFILVTKSGTTRETVDNYMLAKEIILSKYPDYDMDAHTVAVTCPGTPLDNGTFANIFYMDESIGGRFSVCSACAGLLTAIAFGSDIYRRFAAGAHYSDILALNPDVTKNAALLDALWGIYDVNVRKLPVTAVIPYSNFLQEFTYHLQQLLMESNGKSADKKGTVVDYATCPVVIGSIGTNCQHSFFQQLHQGTGELPVEFIGFAESQYGAVKQKKLNSNLAAQITALALGRENEDPNRNFPGRKTSSLLFGKRLTPENLGALFAHFENKTMFQGFLWNINSFDQEGVQLGKDMANQVISETAGNNSILSAYYSFFA